VLNSFFNLFKKYTLQEKRLIDAIVQIMGAKPRNLAVFKLSLLHTSASQKINETDFRLSNERLEYLGDSMLGAIVADYLYKKYPFKDEGFLTEIRSRIVNRESLNNLSKKIGLSDFIEHDHKHAFRSQSSMSGDALEAFVGAVYLDRGFLFCKKFIINRLLIPYVDVDKVVITNNNFKSTLIEWAQSNNKKVEFEILSKNTSKNNYEFTAQLLIDGEIKATAIGINKKKAEQAAAEKVCKEFGLI
jgi:ribonuclease III